MRLKFNHTKLLFIFILTIFLFSGNSSILHDTQKSIFNFIVLNKGIVQSFTNNADELDEELENINDDVSYY
jgi:hypothetical protein